MQQSSSIQLGDFIDLEIWQEAIRLLNYQLQCKKSNRHFNTLSMTYYENLATKRDFFSSEEYFRCYVASNLFYGLSSEFGIYQYVQPKDGLGLRNYVFLSYPMRCTYYAVGIYLLKLAYEFIRHTKSGMLQVHSYYGGELLYEQGEVVCKPQSVYYKNHYSSFRNSVMQFIENSDQNRICLRFDIASYFDTISIRKLLNLLEEYISPSIQRDMNFSSDTINHLVSFFKFIQNGSIGIPQMDNGIISDFIGYLYLLFADMFTNDLLQNLERKETITSYQFFRYVDDMYLFVDLKPYFTDKERDSLVLSIGSQISDMFDQQLSLKCNSKSSYYRLFRETDQAELRNSLKRVSPDEPLPDNNDTRSPQERADLLIKELKVLKSSELNINFRYSTKIDDKPIALETLKEVFTDNVGEILNSKNYIIQLREIFTDFDFDLLRVIPSAILAIICRSGLEDIVREVENYLLEREVITTKEVDLILRFLASDKNFENTRLMAKLKQDPYMEKIIKVFEQHNIPNEVGYFNLTRDKVDKVAEMKQVIRQIEMRVMAEKNFQYEQALNHLQNELHGIVFNLDKIRNPNEKLVFKNYNVNKVISYLQTVNVPITTTSQVRNLFDQRNNNPVSHTGSDEHPPLKIDQQMYYTYHDHVGKCLSYILK
jgi:AbiA family abortive infection protein